MSSICGVCKDQLSKDGSEVICSGGCEVSFHIKCIKTDLEGRKTRSYKDWKCKICRSSQPDQPNVSNDLNIDTDCLIKISEELANLRKEMSELRASVEFMSDKTDSTIPIMKEIKNELALVRKENEQLKVINKSLTSDVYELQDRVRSLEQYTRKNNIEISGLPSSPNENILDILKDVSQTIGVELEDSHISASHRIPSYSRQRTPSIIVQFQRKALKDTWITKYREKRNLSAKQVNLCVLCV
ncbi:uncharacterized protein LOC124372734 [Homalodisca vitripennis]|uniref:uncharacterized protein LOC124372734 n=1 Tax=Homalodisca vitripennis TaxID=197043 RepID=UPI001EEB23CE|nr:uncharacterized protein LOC124372734 [Homalodisca vitripennis]